MIKVRYILDEDEDTEDADEVCSSFHSQAAVSGSAIFLAGEAGIGCAEGVFLVSATMFNYLKLVRLSRVSWKRSTKILVENNLSFKILRLYLASSKIYTIYMGCREVSLVTSRPVQVSKI